MGVSPGVCAVTGASGYVGGMIVRALQEHMPVVEIVRNARHASDIAWAFETPDDMEQQLRQRKVECLVHAAWDMRASSLALLRKTCVEGSRRLFDAAERAGVKRIVFISTISAFAGCRSAYGQTKLSVEGLLPRSIPGVVLRLGLVFGEFPGGVFGNIRKQVQNSRILPMIGSGDAPQFLLHEQTLRDVIRRAVSGEFDSNGRDPIPAAHPQPWRFRDLVRRIAAQEGKKVTLVPIPWRLPYAGIRVAEILRLHPPFRSDSVISFVNFDKNPDFSRLRSLGIDPIPFDAHLSA